MSNPMLNGIDPAGMDCLSENKLTRGMSTEIREQIAGSLKRVHFFSSQVVIKRGAVGHEMWFIVDGTVEVLFDLEQAAVTEMYAKDYFGERENTCNRNHHFSMGKSSIFKGKSSLFRLTRNSHHSETDHRKRF